MTQKNSRAIDTEILYLEYQSVEVDATRVGSAIANELSSALEEAGIQLAFPIQVRVKQWDSLKEKLSRTSIDLQKITDLQDLVGLRLVLLFPRDAAAVGGMVARLFELVRQYDTKERLKKDQFGYLSLHYVVRLRDEQLRKHGLLQSGLQAEIQVRTMAQHLWAEASHVLQYKQEESVPPDLIRAISRLSAVLETVDAELDKVLAERDAYRAGIVNLESDVPLNVDLLQVTLDALWPAANKGGQEHYDYLFGQLIRQGITTQRQLVELIRRRRDEVLVRSAREAEWLRNAVRIYPLENGRITIRGENKVRTISGITPDLIRRAENGIYYGHVALTVTALQFETGERNPLEPID